LYNLREEKNPLDYRLPDRVLKNTDHGPNKTISIEKEDQIIKAFLDSLDWDYQTTKPSEERIKALGLDLIV
jgi:aldehyde:ferredoxin oxidoreductase